MIKVRIEIMIIVRIGIMVIVRLYIMDGSKSCENIMVLEYIIII